MRQHQDTYKHSVIELFEAQVQKKPHSLALIDKLIKYNYEELNEKANQLAHCLIHRNIQPGDFVAIMLDPSAEYIIFILAIIKTGAIYLPLDNLAPSSRLKEIITDAHPKLIITHEQYQSQLSEVKHTISLTKQLHLEAISCSKENLNLAIKSESAIYMMYTSGSTGQPKGVIIPHHAVVNLTKTDNYATVRPNETVAQFSNMAFDASTFEIWSAFLNGACLSIIPIEIRTNHTQLKKFLNHHQINYLFLPTGYFHQLIKSARNTLDSVKVVVFGGEQINKTLVIDFLNYRKKQTLPITLINGYGPTEATTFTCRHIMHENNTLNEQQLMSIGTTINHVKTYVLDEQMNETNEGELYISGINLAIQYHNSTANNQEKFIPNPFDQKIPFNRLYKTGDKVRKLPSGELLCLGRLDDQVKIGGFRIHLNEIEQKLMKYQSISLATVLVELGGAHHKILTAYIVFNSPKKIAHADDIRAFLAEELPNYMLPTKYVMVDELPLTRIGKVDKKLLAEIPHTDLSFHMDTSSSSTIEENIKNIWKHLLNRTSIETHKNLFDLGANSLLITEACSLINEKLQSDLDISDLLAYPTIHKLSRYLEGDLDQVVVRKKRRINSSDIAIIGMSCRFPEANTLEAFWDNLCQGKDCLTRFDINQIVNNESKKTNYVPVKGVISDIEYFDASFFGFNPVDANITDPQQRIFLECVWEALEHASVAPNKLQSTIISVFAGMTDSTYLHENLLKNEWFCQEHDSFQQRIASSTSMLSTQVSYRLNLKGRSVNINTACSTGLITIDQACQDLILGQSDIAIAGASSITVPQINGYSHQEGSIVSPDGYCRPFAENANGTVFSNGVGAVVLQRLEDAVQDNHTIYAVIKASAVNNDGADKLGFTAPSVSGQIGCIRNALNEANITPEDVSFIEAHGTATALGDVIEMNALNSVYREYTDKKQFCALGSVKANIGHTDVTAGIASIIKTALCLYYKKIPPLIHFKAPNPNLSLNNSPFYINTETMDWTTEQKKRYAGVSAFGVGGTNIHMILCEYDQQKPTHEPLLDHEQLFVLSAKTELALDETTHQFTQYLNSNHFSDSELINIAYTLHAGREDFPWRRFAIGHRAKDILHSFQQSPNLFCDQDLRYEIVFMFDGQGTQYHHMAMELYEHSPLFKKIVQQGLEQTKSYLNCDLLDIICNPKHERLMQTEYAQPALFIIEYALAQLVMALGIKPDILIGHSLGEYVAACIAGVFSYQDAIALVCERGLLMSNTPKGVMIALECSHEESIAYQKIADVDIALHNSTQQYVFSGTIENMATLEAQLSKTHKSFKKLKANRGFHSRLIEPIKEAFKDIFTNITLSPPQLSIVSNLTGTWLSASDAIDSEYWYNQLRYSVQFSKGIDLLLKDKHPFFLEIGLGQSLCSFVKDISLTPADVAYTLPSHQQKTSDLYPLLNALGLLWTKGMTINLEPLYLSQNRQYISLPTYPFQRQRYWVEADDKTSTSDGVGFSQDKGVMIERKHIITNKEYVAPRHEVELSLSKLWEASLSIKNISIHDNFFDLGGHSLKAINLLKKINHQFQSRISIQHFYQLPTLFNLSELIKQKNPETVSITVPMRVSIKSSKNIFVCHPASGLISCFEPLISLLPREFSIYGLQDPSLSQGHLIFDTIELMAESYLNAIKKIQPKGPYFLIGYSFGGVLLYEVAYLLLRHNEPVQLLCLIDSWPIFSSRQHDKEYLKQSLRETSADLPEDLISLAWERVKLFLKHVPTTTKQDMLLVKALQLSDDYASINHPLNHWSTFNSGKITCLPINADHESILNEKHSQLIINYLINNQYLHKD